MNKCEICGKIIKNYYRICSECYDRYLDGDIIQCSECNTYHWYNEACPKCNYFDNLPSEGFDECIICGQNSNGYAFCKECWQEYDDEQLLSILNNYVQKENEQVYPNDIDDYRKRYPANFHCRDGHYVRSPYEKIIDEVLYEERIIHEYEKKYKGIDGKIYYPDFYIPDLNLFIEYFGVNEQKDKNLHKQQIFTKDNSYNFEFIWPNRNGILDEVIIEIIEKYKKKSRV